MVQTIDGGTPAKAGGEGLAISSRGSGRGRRLQNKKTATPDRAGGHGLGFGDVTQSCTTSGTIELRAPTSQRQSLVKLDTGAAG